MSRTKFVDLHSHFLFGLDDGAENLDASLAMLDQAASLNFEILLATPHASDMTNDAFSQQIMARFNEVKSAVIKAQIPVKLFLAAEMFYSAQIFKWMKYPWSTINNNKRYFLFELPLFDLPEGVGEFIFKAQLKKMTPILAHPERYRYLHNKVEKLISFVQQGCLIQVNAGSIVGQFGNSTQNFALKLIKGGLAHLVASDAHDVEKRNYGTMVQAYRELEKFCDAETLANLFYYNPKKIIRAENIFILEADESQFNPFLKRWKKKFFTLLQKLWS